MSRTEKPRRTAVEAKSYAQELAFGPIAFHAACAMRDTGLLQAVSDAGRHGATTKALAMETGLSDYGVSVLLDFGLDLGMVRTAKNGYALDHVGYFVLHDEMTRVNMDFTRDVCYEGMPFLEQAIREGRPAGLGTLGPWDTLYQGLNSLDEPARSSWFRFDHFYSDQAFRQLLPIVFEQPPRELLDVGGNTGRWTLECLRYDKAVRVTIADLPVQLAEAEKNIRAAGFSDRVNLHPGDVLNDSHPFYDGADVIWMSQFLDCFSAEQIVSILARAAKVMETDTRLYIVELFPDRQTFQAARFSLDATSLYFTAIANGNSRMYHCAQFLELVEAAGLYVEREINDIGVGHTVLCCRKAS